MIVKHAKDVVRKWVIAEGSEIPGFAGAFVHGSMNWLADDAVVSATSDVDVMVVLGDATPPAKPGKFIYRGVLLDVSYLTSDQIRSAEAILGQYHLAGSFRQPNIILDPTGQLTRLGAAVSNDYANRRWVSARCEDAMHNIQKHLGSLNESDPFHDQVTAWLFGTGVTTHVLLVAGLKNPTVRRRYAAARELLADYGRLDFYETLLELLGCARMSRARAEHHLAALTDAFDAAKTVITTPFFFASDISDVARPIAIEGSRELIASGSHREAIFWMVATYARCQKALYHDAPAPMREAFRPGFRDLLGDLGIVSSADLRRRGEQVEGFLPQVWKMAEAIMAANRDIDDSM
ncbi:MAG: hypothetical protein ACRDJW_12860 [Thermomicrobiales bacterium]